MNPMIVTLDYPNARQALELVELLAGADCAYKVGIELHTAAPCILGCLCDRKICLDLKYHDIPRTVAAAVCAAADQGAWMVTVHASERRVLEAASDALARRSKRPLVVGVTVLTSVDENDLRADGVYTPLEDLVLTRATRAMECGLDGVVCSPHEVKLLREELGEDPILITPGIRLPDTPIHDQVRTAPPRTAMCAGSSYLVVGRPISEASDPLAAYEYILAEARAGMADRAARLHGERRHVR